MSKVGAPYLPIRPAGYKPAPVPYFNELMKAQTHDFYLKPSKRE